MVFWFFGYPGIGKDYLAEKLSKLVKIPHIEADLFLTKTDKEKLIKGTFTQNDRLRKLSRICKYTNKLSKTHPNIIAADSLPDSLSRKILIKQFGKNITFIYVFSSRESHLKRLKSRKNHFFTEKILNQWIKQHWSQVNIPHIPFPNNEKEIRKIESKLLKIYSNNSA